jgi:competence protein ComEC
MKKKFRKIVRSWFKRGHTIVSRKGTYTFPFSRYPAVRIALLLISGVLLGEAFSGGYYLPLGIFGVLAVGLWVLKRANPQSFSIQLTRLSSLLLVLLIIVFGWFRFSISELNNRNTITENLISVSPWEELSAVSIVNSYSVSSSGKLRADVQVISSILGRLNLDQSYYARIIIDDHIELQTGDTLSFSGTIIPISEKRNPNQFDYQRFLADKNIYAQIRLDELVSIKKNKRISTWSWWQNQASRIIEQNFGELTQPLAKALLLGFKQDLDQETMLAFSRTGLSHIMAVSGLHVGFIIAPFWILLPFIKSKKYGRVIGLVTLILVLFFYAGITGFTASVMRASVTAIFLTVGKLFNKSPNSINLTAAAAIILLIINPQDLFSIGFQLSFSAVFIILLILPILQFWMPYWVRLKWYAKPLMVIIVSIVVQLGLYPLQVYYFGEVSVISPISNALFVPLLGLLIPLAIVGTLITPIINKLGLWLSLPLDTFLGWMHNYVTIATTWDWSWYNVDSHSLLIFPLWLFLIFVFSSYRIPELRWKTIVLSCGLLIIVQIQSIRNELIFTPLSITYFDVGQGDAALIQTPNGANVLIDAGVWSPGYNSGKSIILPHLESAGIDRLDAIILSHPHADHIGGILDLIHGIPIDAIYNSGFEYESNLYRNYLLQAANYDIPVISAKAGDILNIDESVLFLILGPEGGRFNEDPNQHSVVVEVIYGETEFLFTGDAGESQEMRILENYSDMIDTDVLKIGHHGSRTSSGVDLMEITIPELSVISVAERNRFNHPHPEAVRRILDSETELLFTSRDKAIVLKSDGKKIWREEWE